MNALFCIYQKRVVRAAREYFFSGSRKHERVCAAQKAKRTNYGWVYMRKIKSVCVLTAVLCCCAQWARADVIRLRDGNRIEGDIQQAQGEKVYIMSETGLMTIDKKDIDFIEETAGAKPEKDPEMLSSAFIDELYSKIRTILGQRKAVFKIKRNCQKTFRVLDRYTKEYIAYDARIAQVTDRLERATLEEEKPLRDQLSIERNSFILKKRALIQDAREMYLKRLEFENELMERLERLFNRQFAFNAAFLSVQEEQIEKKDEFYFHELEKDAQKFLYDFSLTSMPFTETDGKLYVKGMINGSFPVLFLIDLQSPVIAITEQVARNLGLARTIPVGDISLEQYHSVIQFGEPTILRSVTIEGLRQDSLLAVITTTMPIAHIDGILGRSFFYDAIIRPDPRDKKLLLYSFTAREE
jgi:hypothetical protein